MEKISEEEQRSDDYLHPSTRTKLINDVTTELVVVHLKTITDNPVTGCENMFKNKLLDQLKEMYTAFKYQEIHTMKSISNHFGPYIVQRGNLLIKDENLSSKPVQMVDELMKLKDEVDNIVN